MPGPSITEADLCGRFIAAATKPGPAHLPRWIAYPETAGFDILLVRQGDGVQIGVEAKLTLNAKVLAQALPARSCWFGAQVGPDYRAALVPSDKCNPDVLAICAHLGIAVIRFNADAPAGGPRFGAAFAPSLPGGGHSGHVPEGWHEWAPLTRCPVPDYVPDVIAGASAPVALTPWKVKAIRLSVLLEERPVTRADFKALQLSPTNWLCPRGWLERTEAGWIAGPRTPDFRAQHPRNYAEIAADKARWAPPGSVLAGPQAAAA